MKKFSSSEVSEIIQMALSDHVSFDNIKFQYNLSASEVQSLMKKNLKSGSYRAWRERIKKFSSRRAFYK